jgi:hypothetical protein
MGRSVVTQQHLDGLDVQDPDSGMSTGGNETGGDDDDDSEEESDSDGDPSFRRRGGSNKTGDGCVKYKNREHAKNTRMRKKTYIDNLRDQVQQLVDERERVDRQRRIALSRLAEQSLVRKKVVEMFLHYRTVGELNPVKWSKILDGAIELVLPVTPYRSFPPYEVQDAQRHLRGIRAVVQDTASLAAFFSTIGAPRKANFPPSHFSSASSAPAPAPAHASSDSMPAASSGSGLAGLSTSSSSDAAPAPPPQPLPGSAREQGSAGIVAIGGKSATLIAQAELPSPQDDTRLRVSYYVLNEEAVISGDVLMCRWFMRTENAVARGAKFEITKHGFMKAFFSPMSRLTYLEMTYDVMAFMQQLRRASNTLDFSVAPNSLQLALEPSNDARVVCCSAEPHQILQVNKVCLSPYLSLSTLLPFSLVLFWLPLNALCCVAVCSPVPFFPSRPLSPIHTHTPTRTHTHT